MKSNRIIYLSLFLVIVLSSCKAPKSIPMVIDLQKITFHKSRCNGTCPQISLEIDSNRTIYVDRKYYKTKSEADPLYSGRFKGQLSADQYNYLLKLLNECDVDKLSFPESHIMDVSVKTLIIQYNGKRKYLQSAATPDNATELINFLTTLANNRELEKTDEIKQFEQ